MLQQLRTGHKAAAALSLKMGMRSCKELREAKENYYNRHDYSGKGLSAADLETLGTLGSVLLALKGLRLTEADLATLGSLGSVLPALEMLRLVDSYAAPGVQRLAEGLGTGALPAVTALEIGHMHVENAGTSALAAALGRGALPRLKELSLSTPPSATRGWWPSRRPCGGGPRLNLLILPATCSATRASPPSWRHRRRQVRRRRRLEC